MSSYLSKASIIPLVVTNALWAYLLLDRSVTIQNQSDALALEKARVELLVALIPKLSPSATNDQVLGAVRSIDGTVEIKVSGDTVEVGDFVFKFADNRLVSVVPM